MPELSERNFADGLKMKFTLPLVEILHAGAPETGVKALRLVLLSVSVYKRLDTSLYVIIANLHTELKPQVKVSHSMNSPVYTPYTTSD